MPKRTAEWLWRQSKAKCAALGVPYRSDGADWVAPF